MEPASGPARQVHGRTNIRYVTRDMLEETVALRHRRIVHLAEARAAGRCGPADRGRPRGQPHQAAVWAGKGQRSAKKGVVREPEIHLRARELCRKRTCGRLQVLDVTFFAHQGGRRATLNSSAIWRSRVRHIGSGGGCASGARGTGQLMPDVFIYPNLRKQSAREILPSVCEQLRAGIFTSSCPIRCRHHARAA